MRHECAFHSARPAPGQLIWAVICAAAVLPAAADRARAAPAEHQSRFYRIVSDLEKPLVDRIAEHMDAVYAEYHARFKNFPERDRRPKPLHVYRKRADYQAFLASHGINGAGSGGMFFVRGDYAALASFLEGQDDSRFFHTLRHEGFHQFAWARIGGELPPWANEGTAEYFAHSLMADRRLVTGQVPPRDLAAVQQAVAAGRHLPLQQLLTLSGEAWNARVTAGQAGLQYPQSWTVVHFLVHGDARYRAAYNEYLQLLSKGQSAQRAYEKVFGSNVAGFEAAWKKYLAELQPNPESEAASRLGFLANGLLFLQSRGQTVETLDQLKEALRRVGYAYRVSAGHGAFLEFRASDDELFEAPKSADPKKPATLLLLPAAGAEELPEIHIQGLSLDVQLTWEKSEADGLRPRILFEKPSRKS